MRLASGAGHSPNCDGARGNGYSENAEAQKLNRLFIATCSANGISCVDCSSSAGSQAAYLSEQARAFNASGADVKLQWHFNSGGGTGCECLYRPGGGSWQTAADVSAAIASVAGFKDRGAKARTDLFILNSVSNAYIIEVAFIDKWADMQAVVDKYQEIAEAVFTAVTGIVPKKEDDVEITVKAPAAARVGDAVVYRAMPACKFNYAWAYGDGWDDWDSTMKGDRPPTSATEGAFIPKKAGKYRLWIDCIMPDGTAVTTAAQTIIVTDEAILNATVEAQE